MQVKPPFVVSFLFNICSIYILIYSICLVFKIANHVAKAIQEWIRRVAMVPVDGKEGPADVCIIELGGTIGRNT